MKVPRSEMEEPHLINPAMVMLRGMSMRAFLSFVPLLKIPLAGTQDERMMWHCWQGSYYTDQSFARS